MPLSVKGDEIVLGIANEARKIGNGKVAHLGFSFGGNFSAMTGLSGAVDAAIVLGGPVDKAWGKENAENLPFGMPGIIGNDMGFDKEPNSADFIGAVQQFSRRSLLDRADNSPMLVINGANDYFVPQADTLVFQGRRNTEVHLIPDIGHCAVLGGPSKLPEVVDLIARWLPAQIGLSYCTAATPTFARPVHCASSTRLDALLKSLMSLNGDYRAHDSNETLRLPPRSRSSQCCRTLDRKSVV